MENPIQPQFKIRVFNGKRAHLDTLKKTGAAVSPDKDYIDIEACVAYPVIYSEEASLLNTVEFTIDKHADLLLYYFYIGQSVILYGGYYSDSSSAMRHVFSGTVTRVKTQFMNNGRVTCKVECMNYGFTKLGKEAKNFTYPDPNGSRKFAKKDSLSVMDVVKGIAEENKLSIGKIQLSPEAKAVKFTKTNIRYQRNMTDWKFLSILAQDFGCSLWITSDGGTEELNFVSIDKAFKNQSDLSFLFPLYGVVTNIKPSEMQTFDNSSYNRPRIIRDVTVDEDISQATAVSRSAMYFDKDTGEYKEAISKIETDKNGKRTITFYELDEQKVEQVHQDNPELADKIREGGPTSLEWGEPNNPKCASYYYRAVKIYDEGQSVFDKAFFGITVAAKCNMDLNIKSQCSYKIRGILSYHSKDLETSFYLRGLKHVWDKDGCWTELDFIR